MYPDVPRTFLAIWLTNTEHSAGLSLYASSGSGKKHHPQHPSLHTWHLKSFPFLAPWTWLKMPTSECRVIRWYWLGPTRGKLSRAYWDTTHPGASPCEVQHWNIGWIKTYTIFWYILGPKNIDKSQLGVKQRAKGSLQTWPVWHWLLQPLAPQQLGCCKDQGDIWGSPTKPLWYTLQLNNMYCKWL